VRKVIRIFKVTSNIEVKEELTFLAAQLCLSNPHAREQLIAVRNYMQANKCV